MNMEGDFFGSKYPKVVLVDNVAFRRSKDNCSSYVHCHLAPSQVNCPRGLVINAKSLMYREQNAAEVRRLCTSEALVGGAL